MTEKLKPELEAAVVAVEKALTEAHRIGGGPGGAAAMAFKDGARAVTGSEGLEVLPAVGLHTTGIVEAGKVLSDAGLPLGDFIQSLARALAALVEAEAKKPGADGGKVH